MITGDVDAGGLCKPVADRFVSKGLRILATSADIPEFNFCVRRGLAPDLKRRLTQVLMGLDTDDGKQRSIIKSIEYEYTGFVTATEQDYAVIEELIQPTVADPLPGMHRTA